MMIQVEAVFQNGTFKPLTPLHLPEGQRVLLDCLLHETQPLTSLTTQFTSQATSRPEIVALREQLRAARTITELFEVMRNSIATPPPLDLLAILDAERKASGQRSLISDSDSGGS